MVNPAAIKKAAEAEGKAKKAKSASSAKTKKNSYFSSRDSAQNYLRSRENPHSENEETSDEDNEMNYTGSRSGKNSVRGKKKGKFNLKTLAKLAPIAIFLIIIIAIAAVFIGVSSLAPAHIHNNILTVSDDTMYAASEAAMEGTVAALLETGSIPSTFASKLSNNGLEVGYLDNSGTFIAGLRPNPDNSVMLASKTSNKTPSDNSLVIRFGNDIVTSETFGSFLMNNVDFHSAFAAATYGRARNHYDETAGVFYSSIRNGRNVFANYSVTGVAKTDSDSYREMLSNFFQGKTDTTVDNYDPNGCIKYEILNNETIRNLNTSVNYPEGGVPYVRDENEEGKIVKLGEYGFLHLKTCLETTKDFSAVEKYLNILAKNSISGGYNDGESDSVNNYITAANLANSVNIAVEANETYQSMQYFLAIEEPINKMMAGESGSTPINPMMNMLMTPTTNDHGETASAMQSPAFASILTKSYSEENMQSSGNSRSLNRIIDTASDTLASAFGNRTASKDDSKQSSLIKTAQDYTGISQQFDSSSFIKNYSYTIVEMIDGNVEGIASTMIQAITPSIKDSILFKNASELSGIEAGEFFVKGASAFGNHVAQYTMGGSIGDEATIAKNIEYKTELAKIESAADRKNRSPFDITSENTFLGSIFASIGNSLLTSSSFASLYSSLSSLTSSSFNSLLPSSFAESDIEKNYYGYSTACPNLNKIGATGDIYCNKIITFDLDTLRNSKSLNDLRKKLHSELIDNDKGEKVPEEGSSLYKYINYNQARSSAFGNIDSTVCSDIARIKNNRSIFRKFFDNILKFFDFTFSNSAENNWSSYAEKNGCENSKEITGEAFVNSSSNNEWNTYKYAQAYVAISRTLDQVDYFSEKNTNTAMVSDLFIPGSGENPVSTYLAKLSEDYENETDTEYLARISGLSEDEASIVLGYFAYNSYLASLDYENRLAFGVEEKPEKRVFVEETIINPEQETKILTLRERKEYYNVA